MLLAVVLSALMFVVTYFLGGRAGLPGAISISILAGFAVVAALDVANIQREVTVKEDVIIVNSAVSGVMWRWFAEFKFDDIQSVELMRRGEWDKRFAAMIITTSDDRFLTAIPAKVSLTTLADILHRLTAVVSLSDWEPSDSDTRIGVRDELDIDTTDVHGELTRQPIPDDVRLMSVGDHVVEVTIGVGPLLLALVGAIAVGVVLFVNWGDLSVWEVSGYIGGALLGLVLGFLYLIRIGQFVAASYGVGAARKKLPIRPDSFFSGQEDDLMPVMIYDRKSWTATAAMPADYGFLQIDRSQSRLQFEGNKNRWALPLSAVAGCRIEESLVGSEASHTEKRYFVVIEARHDGRPWEAGMIYTRTEVGRDSAEARYNRARLLFTQLADVL